MDQADEPRAASGRGPLQHLLIAVGIAEGKDRAPSDKFLNSHGLAWSVINEIDLRFPQQDRFAVLLYLEFRNEACADHLLRRYAVAGLRPHPHEFDRSA